MQKHIMDASIAFEARLRQRTRTCAQRPKATRASKDAAKAKLKNGTRSDQHPKCGRWEKWERMVFLYGYRLYGKGKWSKISKLIPTRYARM